MRNYLNSLILKIIVPGHILYTTLMVPKTGQDEVIRIGDYVIFKNTGNGSDSFHDAI